LRDAVSAERQQLKTKHGQPYQERYRAFLAELATGNNENALSELRRQRDTSPAPTGTNTIESAGRRLNDEKDTAINKAEDLAHSMAYSIDRAGNVTYYADQAKHRALVIDSGQRVTVAADKDRRAVEAGLRLAVQKFGPNLKIRGTDGFKRQVMEAALKTGLGVEFDDPAMKAELQRQRIERNELQARGRAVIAAERGKSATWAEPRANAKTLTPKQAPKALRKSRGR
jgi:hypothetical protein